MSHLQKALLLVCTFFALAFGATMARAEIVVITGVNNLGTDNVLLNSSTGVSTVTGTFGPANAQVNFTSASGSGLLDANPSGQATISGGTGNDLMTQLTFGLASGDSFTRAVFNINASTDGSVVAHVEGINISGGFFEDAFLVDADGQNFFTIDSINGQFITSISLMAINGATIDDLRQVRLGGLGGLAFNVLPEPTTALLMAVGLAGIAGIGRRCRSAQ